MEVIVPSSSTSHDPGSGGYDPELTTEDMDITMPTNISTTICIAVQSLCSRRFIALKINKENPREN